METLFARLRLSDRTGDLQMSTLRFMVMALASKENTCKKTGVSATRDVGDAIACAAMHVLLLCAAFESCRSSVTLAVAFAGINLLLKFR